MGKKKKAAKKLKKLKKLSTPEEHRAFREKINTPHYNHPFFFDEAGQITPETYKQIEDRIKERLQPLNWEPFQWRSPQPPTCLPDHSIGFDAKLFAEFPTENGTQNYDQLKVELVELQKKYKFRNVKFGYFDTNTDELKRVAQEAMNRWNRTRKA
mgnify:CR=1 FL=1